MSGTPGWIEGPAFPPLVKLLAVALVAAMLAWGVKVSDALMAVPWTLAGALVMGMAVALVLWCVVWIVRSRTGIDADHIRQSWMWNKEVALADVTQARLIGVPGLSWLVAPRLVVRARGRGLVVFHAADRQVLSVLARVCLGSMPVK